MKRQNEEEARKAQEEALRRQAEEEAGRQSGDSDSSSEGSAGESGSSGGSESSGSSGSSDNYASASSYSGSGSKGQQIANYACQFIGNPYVPGGTSLTQGADCSGFVWRVYKDFGSPAGRYRVLCRTCGSLHRKRADRACQYPEERHQDHHGNVQGDINSQKNCVNAPGHLPVLLSV